MLRNLILILTIFSGLYNAQSISPSVINSGGKTSTTAIGSQTVIYTDNIGEAIIGTNVNNSNMVTQGFLQPFSVMVNSVSVTVFANDVSCSDKNDGLIRFVVPYLPVGATIEFFWNPDTLCPSHNCGVLDNLSPRTYTVWAVWKFADGTKDSIPKYVVKIKEGSQLCELKVFTGVQLSGGNPKFTIENIESYPDARVSIYTRWGTQVFNKDKYNNADNYWPAKGEKVVPGTYFYIIDAGKAGIRKSWLEVFE